MDTIQSELRQANIELDARLVSALVRLASSGYLSFGWPQAKVRLPRLIWFPSGQPNHKTTAIVSSRLGRKLDRQDEIFRLLRTACAQLDPLKQMLITSAGTTTHPFVLRAAELFGIPILQVKIARDNQSLHDWIEATADVGPDSIQGLQTCLVSPPLVHEPPIIGKLRDRLLVLSSHQLLVLHARAGGTLVAQLSERLAAAETSRTFLALGSDCLVPASVAEPLMRQGAVGWFVRGPEDEEEPNNSPLEGRPLSAPAPIISLEDRNDKFLTHCTRRAKGAWPDQSEEEFLDELIFGEPKRDRSSLAALIRIVAMRKLLASGEAIRGGAQVVSFTAASTREMLALRTFRAHRGRWDFERYGICIDQTLLQSLGARAVIYGDEATWESLSATERPLFQKKSAAGSGIDWSVEREWRCLGDVDLEGIPSTHAVVFVPTEAEAQHIAKISPWPVAVIGYSK